jgi:putative methyltransferase (TIGR04325 family)
MSGRLPAFVRATLVAKGLTPPYLWALLKAIRARVRPRQEPEPQPEPAVLPPPEPSPPPEWEYVAEGWARPAGGWDVDAIARAYREKWPSFLEAVAGPGPLGIDHEVPMGTPVRRDDRDAQQTIIAFGYALALAARGGRLSLLDWGGGPGHYAVLARALVPGIELEYWSKDVPTLAALGRELLPEENFVDDDSCLERRYELVLASSSLQYTERWRETLAGLAGATGRYLYVTRLPVSLASESFVVLQRAHRYGYETEYLGWVLNRGDLLEEARRAGLELVREFLLPDWLSAEGSPESPVDHRGFLFAPVRKGRRGQRTTTVPREMT